jgi:hypothetical protein
MGELCPIVPHWGSSFIRCGSLKFEKHAQLFIAMNDKPFSVAAMRVCNADRSPLRIHG